MIRISLPYVFQVATELDALDRLPSETVPVSEVRWTLIVARVALERLLRASVFAESFRSSVSLGADLLEYIREAERANPGDANIEDFELQVIKSVYQQYKIALLAELGVLPSYFVTRKGSHDTLSLLEQGHSLFPAALKDKAPEAIFDAAEAGKALAFELPTACGFHAFRVMEAVLRRYYALATGGNPAPKVRNIGAYVRGIRAVGGGDDRILSTLEQIARLHRNPLIHPEVALSPDEAIATLGMAHSAVTSMLAVLPAVPQTTTTAAQTPP